jgi:hypothetical protein
MIIHDHSLLVLFLEKFKVKIPLNKDPSNHMSSEEVNLPKEIIERFILNNDMNFFG